jgi:hypothetical protein
VTIGVDNFSTGAIPPTTEVLLPSNGSWVSGSQVPLNAGASDNVGVAKVQFHLTGGSLNNALIATGTRTYYGWLAYWDSTSVPDGTYTLQSDAYDAAGNQGVSASVTIIVENTPPATSIVIPASGASVSGGQVTFDAQVPAGVGVNKVEFHLTGGSLNNALIATGSPSYYGWLAKWNSTTIPNGTYALQSDAYDAAGNQGVSTAVTVIVDNPPPTTSILIPSSGASVSGTQVTLDAGATDSGGVAKVNFSLTGGSLNNDLIATATPTEYGWLASWNSTLVPNGSYTLQSDAYDAAGHQGVSTTVTVIVENTPPTTSILIPSSGASVSGTQVTLDAGASDSTGVTKVTFYLSGASLNNDLIATATPTKYGWLASWNSTTVPNGTYTLQSEAYDALGLQGLSTAETVIVDNPPPTTSILIPSSGASVSGTQVTLDAGATDSGGVAKVNFSLTGGPLNDALIATGTLTYYGWLASWNSTSVPDGTYTLQSDAYDAAGDPGVSTAISVTVAN